MDSLVILHGYAMDAINAIAHRRCHRCSAGKCYHSTLLHTTAHHGTQKGSSHVPWCVSMCSHSTLDTRFGRAITARHDTMSAAKTREKMVRLVLYVSQSAVTALAGSADRRAAASGIEVTPEAEARALLYAGLGLGADGLTPKEHEAALSPATRAGLDAGLASARSAPPVYLGSFAPPGLTSGARGSAERIFPEDVELGPWEMVKGRWTRRTGSGLGPVHVCEHGGQWHAEIWSRDQRLSFEGTFRSESEAKEQCTPDRIRDAGWREAPQGGGGPVQPRPELAYTGLLCVECREPQYETPGGETCQNGHDGAGSMDPPTYEIERRVRS